MFSYVKSYRFAKMYMSSLARDFQHTLHHSQSINLSPSNCLMHIRMNQKGKKKKMEKKKEDKRPRHEKGRRLISRALVISCRSSQTCFPRSVNIGAYLPVEQLELAHTIAPQVPQMQLFHRLVFIRMFCRPGSRCYCCCC